MNGYVGPVDNPCEPGTASTFTEELGKHCVDLYQKTADLLPATGGDGNVLAALAGVAGGLILVALVSLAASWWAQRNRE